MSTLWKIFAVALFAIMLASSSSSAFAETSSSEVDDATLTSRVKTALLADSRLKSMHVSVESVEGTVMLGGTVDSKGLESAAIKIADGVEGVQHVEDNITVRNLEAAD